MRIAFFGNICNNLYQIARALRQEAGIQAHLFLDSNQADFQQLPENDDPSLAGDYPDWIHSGQYVTARTILAPWTSPLVRELDSFDLVVVSGYGPMIAQFVPSKPNLMFLVAGGDLNVWPFPLRYHAYYPGMRKKIGLFLRAFWQRSGIRNCTEIWAQPFTPYQTALRNLKVNPDKVSNTYYPLIVDSERFDALKDEDVLARPALAEIRNKFDFILFSPSRIMMRARPPDVMSGNWKANDQLIRGFAQFLQRTQSPERCLLLLIDRTANQDTPMARALIDELGIQNSVLWLKPSSPLGYSRDELISLYKLSDVVADDFGVGWLGSIQLEGLAAGRPVLSHVSDEGMSLLYPWHPILNCRTPEEIGERLDDLARDRHYRQESGKKSRLWIHEFHSARAASRIYVRHFQAISERLGYSSPVAT